MAQFKKGGNYLYPERETVGILKCSQCLGWRDGSAAASWHFSWRPEFSSQCTHWEVDNHLYLQLHRLWQCLLAYRNYIMCRCTRIDKNEIKHNLKCSISHVNCKLKLPRATTVYSDNVGAVRETPSHCWQGQKMAQVLQNTVEQFLATKQPLIQQPYYLVPTQMALRFISMCKFTLGVYGHIGPHRWTLKAIKMSGEWEAELWYNQTMECW